MAYKFTSAITRGGSVIRPDVIEIDSASVTYKKRNSYLINSDTISIPINKVSSVSIDTSIIGTKIIIEGPGRQRIIAEKFSKADAIAIKKIIERTVPVLDSEYQETIHRTTKANRVQEKKFTAKVSSNENNIEKERLALEAEKQQLEQNKLLADTLSYIQLIEFADDPIELVKQLNSITEKCNSQSMGLFVLSDNLSLKIKIASAAKIQSGIFLLSQTEKADLCHHFEDKLKGIEASIALRRKLNKLRMAGITVGIIALVIFLIYSSWEERSEKEQQQTKTKITDTLNY